MHIGYQPLWRTLKERRMRKEDLRLAAGLTTNMIANMGKGKHISMDTLTKICETLDCGILDVIELVRDEERTHESDKNRLAREAAAMGSTIPTRQLFSISCAGNLCRSFL